MSFITELRSRKLIPWAAAYLATAWGGLQVLSLLSDSYNWSPAIMRAAPVVLVGGLLLVIIIAWFHGNAGRQRPVLIELLLVGIVVASTAGMALTLGRQRDESDTLAIAADTVTTQIPASVYDEFTRARLLLTRINRADTDSATRLLEQVVAREPRFAEGHAQLAAAYSYQSALYRAEDPIYEQKALLAAERALSLDPRIAEAHSVRGRMLWTPQSGYAHVAAATEFLHALALRPDDVDAMFQLAQIFMHVGLLQEAIDLHEHAARLRPIDPRPRVFRALSMFYQGDVVRAMDIFRSAPATFNPAFIAYHVAWGLWRQGEYDEAMRRIEAALPSGGDDAGVLLSMRAMLHARGGRVAAARSDIERVAKSNRNSIQYHHAAYNIGIAYTVLAQPDSAIRWLRFAADDGLQVYPLFKNDPDLRALQRDARFQRLLADLQRREAEFRREYAAISKGVAH
jgi:tetratricopeptide (TPR) repeat protein